MVHAAGSHLEDGEGPTLIVDDGGDATLLIHLGKEHEEAGTLPDPASTDNAEEKVIFEIIRAVRAEKGDTFFTEMGKKVRGVSEETTTGVMRLLEREVAGTLLFPVIIANDSVTKSTRQRIRLPVLSQMVMRATDDAGGRASSGIETGKGSVQSLVGQGTRVSITEIDPICALQACMQGLTVTTIESALADTDIFVTATGNKDIITASHMAAMKHNAIVCNIGHFDNEIDMAGLAAMEERGEANASRSPQVHEWKFKTTTHGPGGKGHSIIILAEGRLVNLGCATGHPSFVMSASFTNQTLAQLELHANAESYGKTVTVLPKRLDEEVARLHLEKFGAELTELSKDQADYINVEVEGPFKTDAYRY